MKIKHIFCYLLLLVVIFVASCDGRKANKEVEPVLSVKQESLYYYVSGEIWEADFVGGESEDDEIDFDTFEHVVNGHSIKVVLHDDEFAKDVDADNVGAFIKDIPQYMIATSFKDIKAGDKEFVFELVVDNDNFANFNYSGLKKCKVVIPKGMLVNNTAGASAEFKIYVLPKDYQGVGITLSDDIKANESAVINKNLTLSLNNTVWFCDVAKNEEWKLSDLFSFPGPIGGQEPKIKFNITNMCANSVSFNITGSIGFSFKFPIIINAEKFGVKYIDTWSYGIRHYLNTGKIFDIKGDAEVSDCSITAQIGEQIDSELTITLNNGLTFKNIDPSSDDNNDNDLDWFVEPHGNLVLKTAGCNNGENSIRIRVYSKSALATEPDVRGFIDGEILVFQIPKEVINFSVGKDVEDISIFNGFCKVSVN